MTHLTYPEKNSLLVLLQKENQVSEIDKFLLVFALVVIIALLFLIVKYNNERKRAKLLLRKQKTDMDRMNRKLNEGYGYAERIQTAILPAPDKVQHILNDYFIVFQPKQMVSGDFYWVEQREQRGVKKMFAVVDCTGHGIPGALMSIIGYDGLNRAIIDYELTRADKIVSALNEYLTETLKLTGSVEVKDAMDIALCVYNEDKSQIEFTGARSPLYLLRESENMLLVNDEEQEPVLESEKARLFVVKPDRKSVEPTEKAEVFTNKHIFVEKGDVIYIFSDGFADQFGGDQEKKFGYKRLRETLLSFEGMSMKDQKKKLEQVINNWKADYEQVDDITFIGKRI